MGAHPDFANEYARAVLGGPGVVLEPEKKTSFKSQGVSNSMFETTLYTDRGIRAYQSFRRPSREPDAMYGQEDCLLMSVGDGLDGALHRAHGGFNSLVLDQVAGRCAHDSVPGPAPAATATLTVEFKAPVQTPGLLLCRAWVTATERRKIWVSGVLEDANGRACATCKALFIAARPAAL